MNYLAKFLINFIKKFQQAAAAFIEKNQVIYINTVFFVKKYNKNKNLILGFNWRKILSRPILTKDQIKQRFFFAKRNYKKSFKKWIFVDETKLQTYSNPLYHMRLPATRVNRKHFSKRNFAKINIWGGISWNGHIKFFVIF